MHEEKESEHLANTRKTSPKDLEEASEKYGHNKHPMTPTGAEESQEDFIAGAKWQKEQDRLEIANIKAKLWQEGFNDCKEQMMKEAVEADVNIYGDIVAGKKWAEFVVEMPTNNLGDKVHIIVVKEDEKWVQNN